MLDGVTVLMSSSVSRTTSTTETNFVVLPSCAQGADIFLNVGSLTGSGATLIVAIQKGWVDLASTDSVIGVATSGTINWIDQWSFTQVTTSTGTRHLSLGTSGNSENAWAQDALATNIQQAGPLGDLFRVSWQVGGTTPVASFSVVGKFYF
jgi:hypothetical protein